MFSMKNELVIAQVIPSVLKKIYKELSFSGTTVTEEKECFAMTFNRGAMDQ